MEVLIPVNQRGALTLPKGIREQAGIPNGGPVRIQTTSEGTLLTPVATLPIEIYTPERIAEVRLNSVLNAADYQAALQKVRKMGIDPNKIPHQPIKKGGW